MKRLKKPFALALALALAVVPVVSLAATQQSVAALAKSVGDKYGITVMTDDIPTIYKQNFYYKLETDYDVLEQQIKVLDGAMSRYPASFFKNARLRSVSFVKDITTGRGATNEFIQAITAAYGAQTMLVARSDSDRSVYDHEFSHLLDTFRIVSDKDWAALNVEGFRYSGGFMSGDVLPPGIVSSYGGAEAKEDRAELMSFVMNDAQQDYLRKLCAHDEVLKKKLVLLKSYMTSTMGSGTWSTRIDELIATPQAQPLYYATSSSAGRTGPGNAYGQVKVDATAPLAIVQEGRQYVKALVNGVGVYFPANSITRTNAPAQQPQQAAETPAEPQAPVAEPTGIAAADKLAALGMTYTANPPSSSVVTSSQVTDAKTLETVLAAVYEIASRDGFVNTQVTVVRNLAVKGKAQSYAYTKNTLFVDAQTFNASKLAAFNKTLLGKYPNLAA